MYRKASFIVVAVMVAFLFGCGGGGSSSSRGLFQSTDSPSPSQPTTPTTPTNPSDPANPTNPSDPTNPPANVAPVANAGTAQTVMVGDSATLDGTESSDPDGNYPLIYTWQMLSKPTGSQATLLSDPASVNPSFTADKAGDYSIQLVVTDSLGLSSDPAVVVVSTVNSAPVANAGPDQLLDSVWATVQLDGGQSYDFDGDPITYSWSLTTKPAGSTATLSDPTAANPTFVADLFGKYVVQLQVSDGMAVSAPDEVQVNFANVKPVADAGVNQTVVLGDTVYLDGSASSDANMDVLTYSWAIVSAPAGGLAQPSNATTVTPTFVPDVEGMYVLSLVVNDGALDSLPSNVIIVAKARAEVDDFVQTCMHAISTINGLDASDFKNPNMRDVLTKKINVTINQYLKGDYSDAYDKLTGDVAGKMDGCADSGDVDGSDWIINCTAQESVYPYVQEAISILENLLTT